MQQQTRPNACLLPGQVVFFLALSKKETATISEAMVSANNP